VFRLAADREWFYSGLGGEPSARSAPRQAARHDRHWRTSDGSLVDHRTGAGLFVLYGLLAAAPALVTAVQHPRSRVGALCMAGVVLAIALLCETVVELAPQPWFTF
jgi:hypothetical protein